MASLMNMALVAGSSDQFLNQLFVVGRGDYSESGALLMIAAGFGWSFRWRPSCCSAGAFDE